MLAKFVFVALKYNGWEGMNAHALHEKAEPFKFAVKRCCGLPRDSIDATISA